MSTIAVIPARGGSKRLPGKNILELKKVPLLVHSITYALKNKSIVNEVYVSTDNDQIKDIALQYGAKVIERPESLSQDNSTTVSALKHTLQQVEYTVDNVVLLQPTNPLRPIDLLNNAFRIFEDGQYDSLMTVSSSDKKLGKIVNDQFQPFNYTMGQRSQDMEPLYYENGLLYITKASLILDNLILGENNYPFVLDHPYASVDIDTEEDLKYAQFVLENYPNE